MLRSDFCDYSDTCIVVNGAIRDDVIKEIKNYPLRIMLNLDHAYQKSIIYLWAMRKMLILLCQCIC